MRGLWCSACRISAGKHCKRRSSACWPRVAWTASTRGWRSWTKPEFATNAPRKKTPHEDRRARAAAGGTEEKYFCRARASRVSSSTTEGNLMSSMSTIEWTDATWNPVRGCTKITPGCTHCYAETFAERFRGVPGHPYEQGFELRLVPEKLAEPLRWKTPKMIFVNSMSDLFHEEVPENYIAAVADVMMKANWHTYQVLTKRSSRMQAL